MLESADANRQIDRLVCDFFQLLGIIHRKRNPGSPWRTPKASARQLDHARRDIDPDPASDFRCKSEEVMAIAATQIEDDIGRQGPGQIAHKRKPVFEQAMRVTVLLMRSGCCASIEERPEVGSAGRGSSHDTTRPRPRRSPFRPGCLSPGRLGGKIGRTR
jgi:hypothetical protein